MTAPIDPIAVAVVVSRILDELALSVVQGGRLDRTYLEEAAPTLGVADLLIRALREGAN